MSSWSRVTSCRVTDRPPRRRSSTCSARPTRRASSAASTSTTRCSRTRRSRIATRSSARENRKWSDCGSPRKATPARARSASKGPCLRCGLLIRHSVGQEAFPLPHPFLFFLVALAAPEVFQREVVQKDRARPDTEHPQHDIAVPVLLLLREDRL